MARTHHIPVLVTLLLCGCSDATPDAPDAQPYDASPQDASWADTSSPPDDAGADVLDTGKGPDIDAADVALPIDASDASDAAMSPDVPDTWDKCSQTLWSNSEPLRSVSHFNADRQREDTLALHAEVEGSHYSFEGVVDEVVFLGVPEPDAYIVWLTTTRPELDPPTLSLSFSVGGTAVPDVAVGEALRWERVERDLDCVVDPGAMQQFESVDSVRRLGTGEVAYMHGALGVFEDHSVGLLHPMDGQWDGLRWEDDECPIEDLDFLGIFDGGSTVRLVFPPPANVTAKMGATDIELVGFPDTIHVSWPQRPDFANTTNRCGRVRFAMVDAP